jgi:hypothetical protein
MPDGTTLAKAVLMVKASLDIEDEDALITKTIYPGSTADGQIIDTGADGTGSFRFVLDNDDVDAFETGTLYISGVKAILSKDYAHDVDELTVPVRVREPVVRTVS